MTVNDLTREEVLAGLDGVVKLPEFCQQTVVDGQPMKTQLYSSGREFLARKLVKDALMNFGHLIPAVAAKREAIAAQESEIVALLTPTIPAT